MTTRSKDKRRQRVGYGTTYAQGSPGGSRAQHAIGHGAGRTGVAGETGSSRPHPLSLPVDAGRSGGIQGLQQFLRLYALSLR